MDEKKHEQAVAPPVRANNARNYFKSGAGCSLPLFLRIGHKVSVNDVVNETDDAARRRERVTL